MKKRSLGVVAALTTLLMVGVSIVPAVVAAEPAQPKIQVVAPDGTPTDAIEVVGVEKEGDRMILRVRNRTPFIVIVYIHGRRVGWLRPFRTGLLRGLRRGFHRLYAHSRWGSFYWGPRSIWVPGTWSLYR
jgi:hypothetical protein